MNTIMLDRKEENNTISLYAQEPSEKVSPYYQFVSTERIVKLATEHGWQSDMARYSQANTRKKENMGKQKHLLILTKPEFESREGIMQLAIRNAHNGTSSIQMFQGYMRIACANQLFAKNFGSRGLEVRVNHSGNPEFIEDRIVRGFYDMEEKIKEFNEVIGSLREKTLTMDQIRQFAERSIYERFRYSQWENYTDFVPDLIQPRREEDTDNSAWVIFNRVQEKLVKGFKSQVRVYENGEYKVKNFSSKEVKSPNVLPNLNNKLLEALSNAMNN